MPQEFNNADAVVLNQNQPNWLQGFAAGRAAGQPNYKMLSYQLQRERLAAQAEKQQNADFEKARNEVYTAEGRIKVGDYSSEVSQIGKEYLDKLSQAYLSGNRDPELARQYANSLLALSNKSEQLQGAFNNALLAGEKDPYINKTALYNFLKKRELREDGTKKSIYEVNPDDLSLSNAMKDPGFYDLIDRPQLFADYLHTLGTTKINESTTAGNALGSSQNKLSAAFSKATTFDPVTQHAVFKTDTIELDPETYKAYTQQIGEGKNSALGVNDELYNDAMGKYDIAILANSHIQKLNTEHGLSKGDKGYIDPNSQEGENLKKIWLLHNFRLHTSESINTEKSNRTTMAYWAMNNPEQYDRYQSAKGQYGNERNLLSAASIAFSGKGEQLQTIGKRVPSSLIGITGVPAYNITDKFKDYATWKDQKGKKHPYYAIFAVEGQPGIIYAEKTEDSPPETLTDKGLFLQHIATHNPSTVVNSEKLSTLLGYNINPEDATTPSNNTTEPPAQQTQPTAEQQNPKKQNIIQRAAKAVKDTLTRKKEPEEKPTIQGF